MASAVVQTVESQCGHNHPKFWFRSSPSKIHAAKTNVKFSNHSSLDEGPVSDCLESFREDFADPTANFSQKIGHVGSG